MKGYDDARGSEGFVADMEIPSSLPILTTLTPSRRGGSSAFKKSAKIAEEVRVVLQAIFRIIARNPPSILISGGVILHLSAIPFYSLQEALAKSLMRTGWTMIVFGVLLQVLWLVLRRGRF